MKSLFYLCSAFAVMALAFWAYQENYRTQKALRDMAELQREIGQLRQTLAMHKAEWAYLNRPERLAELAEINFDRLGLFPLTPEQFGQVDQIVFPNPTFDISQPIELSGQIAPQETSQ